MLRLGLFGDLRVEVDGREIPPPRGSRTRGVLAWLALNPGLHPRSRVAGRFWPDVLEESARGSLRRTLSELRRTLGSDGARYLVAERDRIGLPASEEVWVDARRFDALVAEGSFVEALELCDGELLADLGDEWALEARDEHEARLGDLLGRLVAAAIAADRHGDAVALARRRVALDPLSEEAGRDLIVALGAAGDRSGALAAFERLRERLAGELRLAPSAETTRLVEEVRRGHVPRNAAAIAPMQPPRRVPPPDAPAPLPHALRRLAGGVFAGRGAELTRLRNAFERAAAGERRVVAVAGEAGIGKTRLLAELCGQAHAEAAPVFYGRCYEGSAPYEPLVEALSAYVAGGDLAELRSRAGPGAAELARLVPELGAPETSAPAVSDPDGARYRLFDAIGSLIATAATAAPPVLAIDDAHWADQQTLALLRHLARSPGGRLLIVLGFRLGEDDSRLRLSALLTDLRGADSVERATLGGLNEAEVDAVVAGREGIEPSPELAGALQRRTAGNPFFVEELLRRLGETGITGSAEAAAAIGALELPEGVREVIERRLSRLHRGTRPTLEIASVLGREFKLDLLEAVGDDRDVLAALDEAQGAELIREAPGAPGGYAFTHALVGETLYAGLSAARRARMHGAVAAALERTHGEGSTEHAAEIAHHLLAAGPSREQTARAAYYAALAGDHAAGRLSYEAAAAEYERALEALALADDSDSAQRAELLVRLGEARLRAGGGDQARPTFVEAAAAARAAGAPDLLARAALGYGGLGVTILDVDEPTVALLEEAVAAVGPEDSPLRARLLGRLAVELYYDDASRERSEALSAQALEVARRSGSQPAVAYALNARHVALWRCDRLDERLALAAEMVALAERTGDGEGELQGRNWLVTDLFEAGRMDELDAEIEVYEGLAQSLRLAGYEWYAPLWRASSAVLRGDFPVVEPHLRDAMRLCALSGDPNVELVDLMRFLSCTVRGDYEGMHEIAAPMTERKLGSSPAGLSFVSGMLFINAALGREAEARKQLELIAQQGVDRIPFDVNWLDTIGMLAEGCVMLGAQDHSARIYDLLLPYEDRHEAGAGRTLGSWGAVSRHLGLIAAASSRWADAERHFEVALELNERLGFRPWVAWTRCQYAEMLLARGGEGDAGRAAALLSAAADSADQLGLDGLARRVASVRGESVR